MSTEEILEGNKLIAEFMGATYRPVKAGYANGYYTSIDKDFKNFKECFNFCDDRNIGMHPDECYFALPNQKNHQWHYDKEWNYLIPVVEKIEKIKSNEGFFEIYIFKRCCDIQTEAGEDHIIEITAAKDKITAVFLAVVEFIKEYNKKIK